MNYVIYDLETNGINVVDNSIMQMTMLSTDGTILLNEYVYPFDGKIAATEIHKIDEKKLKESNALELDQLVQKVKKVIREIYGRKDVVFVAYNNFGFDQIVLERGFKLVNNKMPVNWYFMDVMPLIKNKFPDLKPNYKLATVYENLIKINKNEEINYHNSLDDCMCLLEIFIKCYEFYDDFKKYTRNQLNSAFIFEEKLTKLLYYDTRMNFEFHGIKNIGDLYKLFKNNQCDIKEFQDYIKDKFEVRNGFYIKIMTNQINGIHKLIS